MSLDLFYPTSRTIVDKFWEKTRLLLCNTTAQPFPCTLGKNMTFSDMYHSGLWRKLTWMPLPFVGTKASTVVVNKEPANFSLLLFFPCTRFTQIFWSWHTVLYLVLDSSSEPDKSVSFLQTLECMVCQSTASNTTVASSDSWVGKVKKEREKMAPLGDSMKTSWRWAQVVCLVCVRVTVCMRMAVCMRLTVCMQRHCLHENAYSAWDWKSACKGIVCMWMPRLYENDSLHGKWQSAWRMPQLRKHNTHRWLWY